MRHRIMKLRHARRALCGCALGVASGIGALVSVTAWMVGTPLPDRQHVRLQLLQCGRPSLRQRTRLRAACQATGGSTGDQSNCDSMTGGEGHYAKRPKWRQRYRRLFPFEQTRSFVQRMGLSSRREWDTWVREGKRSAGPYIPSYPDEMYAEEWQGWDDFLGLLLNFDEAAKVSATLGLKGQEDWHRFVEADPSRLAGLRLPAKPYQVYRSQWRGYEHWLGLPETTLYVPKELGSSGAADLPDVPSGK